MTPLMEIRGLSRRFGGVTAVKALDLVVGEGELVSLIGPNGAGKTTTFNMISGLDRPDEGEILFAAQPLQRLPPEAIAARGLARTFQHGRVFANLSVEDNVLLGAHTRLRAVRPRWPLIGPLAELTLALVRPQAVRSEEEALKAEAREILGLFGDRLMPRLDHPAYSLSYANRRRCEIARALSSNPHLLLLDEPTAGMNPAETAELTQIIRRIRDDGHTIFLIEHKLHVVNTISDKVAVLDHGAKIAEGTAEEVRNNEDVIEAYLGRKAAAHG
jgi:branched-chain amino acid transport system ATP-binding protein